MSCCGTFIMPAIMRLCIMAPFMPACGVRSVTSYSHGVRHIFRQRFGRLASGSKAPLAELACDVECEEQDCLSDYKRNRESDAGELAYEQRALLRVVNL